MNPLQRRSARASDLMSQMYNPDVIADPNVTARLAEVSLDSGNIVRTPTPVPLSAEERERLDLNTRIQNRVREARGGWGAQQFSLLLRNAPQETTVRFQVVTDRGGEVAEEYFPRQATLEGQSGLWVTVPRTALSISVIIDDKSFNVPWSSLVVIGDSHAAIDVAPMLGIWPRYRTPIIVSGVAVVGIGAVLLLRKPRSNPHRRRRHR